MIAKKYTGNHQNFYIDLGRDFILFWRSVCSPREIDPGMILMMAEYLGHFVIIKQYYSSVIENICSMSIMEFLIPKGYFYVKMLFDVYIQNKRTRHLTYVTYMSSSQADSSFINQLCSSILIFRQ